MQLWLRICEGASFMALPVLVQADGLFAPALVLVCAGEALIVAACALAGRGY